jgi:hypothetical protein
MVGSKKTNSKSKIGGSDFYHRKDRRRDSGLVRGGGCVAAPPGAREGVTVAATEEGAMTHAR